MATDRNTAITTDQIKKHTLQQDDISPDSLVWQEPVIDKDLTAAPSSPSEGDRYLVINGWADAQQVAAIAGYAFSDHDDWCSQTFKAGQTGELTKIIVKLYKAGSPPNDLTVEIRNVVSGKPGSTVHDSEIVTAASLGTSPVEVEITFSTPYTVTQGTDYAVVFRTVINGGGGGNQYRLGDSSADEYADGAEVLTTDGGSTWTIQSNDLYFKTYIDGDNADDVAQFVGSYWNFYTPAEGWFTWVEDENKLYSFDGASWTEFAGGGISDIVEDTTPQLGGDLDLNGKNIDFPTTPNISDCLDEDDMVSDSVTKLATQQSIKKYVDDNIKGLYSTSFVDGDLAAGILTVNHALNSQWQVVSIYDNNDKLVIPDEITLTDANNCSVDLSSYGTLTGTWHVIVVGVGGLTTTPNKIQDADQDTKIQTEESADEDKIRFDINGTERALLDSNGLKLENGVDVNEFSSDGTLAGDSDDAVPTEKAVKTYADGLTHFHDRGDPVLVDFDLGDLTTDGTWRDLDFSSIVPAGAKAIAITVTIMDDVANNYIQFRKNGNSNSSNVGAIRTQVANVYNDADLIVSCDTDRVIEYRAINTVWTGIYIIVKGWIK